MISTLLKGGVEVNLSDNIRGETALHWAAWRGLADVVSALLEGILQWIRAFITEHDARDEIRGFI